MLRGMGKRFNEIDDTIMQILIDGTEQMSAADICKMCEHIKRRIIINPNNTVTACVVREYSELIGIQTREQKIKICKTLKNSSKKMSVNKISELTGIPTSSVDRYFKG